MSTVDSSNQVSSTLLAAMNPAKTASSSIQADQDRFMTLLVTQMKNQDPLNPLDNAQVTSQLAQLSTVTGINQLNATMQSLIDSVQYGQSYQAANLVGHGVLVDGNSTTLVNGVSQFGVDLPIGADSVKVTIRDAAGNQVKQVSLGAQQAGILPLSWDGTSDAGAAMPNGTYKLEVSATSNKQAAAATPLSYQQINSVTGTSSGAKLNLSDLSQVTLSDLKQIF